MSSTTNPSAARQAREAQAEAIEELKRRNAMLAQVVDELKTGLDESIKSNKTLRKKVSSLQAAHEELADQFQNAHNEQKSLRRFKTRATKLLLALSAGHSMEEMRNQVLAAAVTSGDPSTYLAALVEDENIGSEDEEDTVGAEEDEAGGAGGAEQGAMGGLGVPLFGGGGGGGGGPVVVNQEKISGLSLLKEAVNDALFHLLGVVSVIKPEKVIYPHGLTPDDPAWPSEGTGDQRKPYLRFDFTKRHDDPVNEESFKTWCKFVRNRGPERVPKSAAVLEQATDTTIQERCLAKYNYEREKYRTYLKEQATIAAAARAQSPQDGSGDHDTADDGVVQASQPVKKKGTAAYRSRNTGKLKSRARRMVLLPENAGYSQMQKDTMLTPGAQSQDESEYEPGPDGVLRKTNNFITRPWPFLSDEFKAMKAAIDEINDPNPPQSYHPRKVGAPREGDPPRNLQNEHLLREWMVSREVLDAHPEWTCTRRVIGDNEPLKSKNIVKQRAMTTGALARSNPDIKNARRKLKRAKNNLANNLAGKSFEKLHKDLEADVDNRGDDEYDYEYGGKQSEVLSEED